MKSTVLSALLGLFVLLGTCSGHGYIHQSRSHLCHSSAGSKNKNCGAVQWEPQSIEAPQGFPGAGPEDGHIASGQLPHFHELDGAGADRWTLTPISTYVVNEKDGKLVLDFPWTLTAPHMTAQFEYFISKPTFDPKAPLTRAQLELTPFCVDASGRGAKPNPQYTSHNCMLDATQYSGHHVILGVWVIGDTPNAFYQVIDVDFSAKPESGAKPESEAKPEPEAKPETETRPECVPKSELKAKPEPEAKPELSSSMDSSSSMSSSSSVDSS